MEQKIAETAMKQKIAGTALKEFLQHGIRDITIARLVAPLGISTKTVYKYFESKEDLLKECLHILYSNHLFELRKIINAKTDPVNKMLIVFRAALKEDFGISNSFYHDLNYYYPELQNEAVKRISDESGALILPVVEQGIRDGYFLSGLYPEISLLGIGILYTSITRGSEYQDGRHSPQLLFENLVEIYVRGMCTEKGRKQIKNHLKDK
jgi:AcrR family transcriptional regulator